MRNYPKKALMGDEELHAHWDDCPLPPDANCEPCREFARRFLKGGSESMDMKRCVVHNNNAMPKDRHCSGWWWANGGDPKAGLAEPCEFKPAPLAKRRTS